MKECASLALVLALCSTSLAIDLSENDPARSLLQQCQSSFLCRCSHCLHTLLSFCPLFSAAVHTVFTLSCPSVLFFCRCSHCLHTTLLSFCPLFSVAVHTVFTLSCPSVLFSLLLFTLSSHSGPTVLFSLLPFHTVFTLSGPTVLFSLLLFTLSSHSPVLLSSFLCCCSHCLHTLRSYCPLFSIAVHTVFTLSGPIVLFSVSLFALSSHSGPTVLFSLLLFALSSHSPVLLSSFLCCCSHCLHTLRSYCPSSYFCGCSLFIFSGPTILFTL